MTKPKEGYFAVGDDLAELADTQKILKLLNIDDDMSAILRGHQITEKALEIWIRKITGHEKILDFGKFYYGQKSSLAKGTSIPEDLIKTFDKINTIRNGIAHRSNEELSDSDIESFATLVDQIDCFNKEKIGSVKNQSIRIGSEQEGKTISYKDAVNRIKFLLAFCTMVTKTISIFVREMTERGIPISYKK